MIRRAVFEDIPRMAEINVYGWRNTYRGIISDEELFINRRVDKSIEKYKTKINDENRQCFVYQDENDGIIKAMFCLASSMDEDKLEAFELVFIYVEKAFDRMGIGKIIIEYFESEGKIRNKCEFIVWVLEKNMIGRSFYEKMGYIADGKMKYE